MVESGSIGWVRVMLAGCAARACLRSRRKAPPYDPLSTMWSPEWVKREKEPTVTLHILAHGLPDPEGPARPVAGHQFEALSELETPAGVTDRVAFWRRFNHLPLQYGVWRGQDALHQSVHERIAKGELTPQ